MKPVTITALQKAKRLPPVLLIFGEERLLVEETLQQLLQEAYRRGVTSQQVEFLNCEELPPEQLLSRMMAYPLLGGRRLLILRRAERLAKLEKRKEGTLLRQLLERPIPENTLVFVASLPTLDGISRQLNKPRHQATVEKKLRKAPFPFPLLLEHHLWIEHPKLYDREIPSWAGERIRQHSKSIDPDALELLIQYAGDSLYAVHNEIEKLVLYVGDRPKITAEDAAALAGFAREHTIFDLQAAIGKADLPRALRILKHLLTVQRQSLIILTMLTRYFTVLLKLAQLRKRNTQELSKITGINAFFIPEYLAALQQFPLKAIVQALDILYQADARIKRSGENAEGVLTEAIIAIIRNAKGQQ